jgi:cyclase
MSQTRSPQASRFTRREALRTVALTLGATALPTAFGFLSPAVSPSSSAASSMPPMVLRSLGGKFSLITGAGGNIAVLGGDDGLLAIDSGLPNLSAQTAAEIAKSGRIALLVNTHWHPDHVGGNEVLAKAGAQIMAHGNCRQRLSTDQLVEGLNMKVPATAAAAWPRVTFTSETTLHLNGDEIRLVPVPPAHTDGDIIVRFEKADVIHAGDVFFNGRYPLIDYSTGGWIGGMITATKTLSGMTTSKTRIIPGHGPLATREDLRGYLIFLETMLERFTKLKNEGRSVDEVVAAAPAKEFDEKLGQGFITPEQFVRITYTGLLKH